MFGSINEDKHRRFLDLMRKDSGRAKLDPYAGGYDHG